MAADWITEGLSQIPSVEAVPTTGGLLGRQPARPSVPTPGEDPVHVLARETGAGTVVTGAYYLEGDSLRVQASVIDARDGKVISANDSVIVQRRGDLSSLDQLASGDGCGGGPIAGSVDPAVDRAVEGAAVRGLREWVAGAELFISDPAQAIHQFQRAAEIDPGFFMPRFQLAVAYGNLVRTTRQTQPWVTLREPGSVLADRTVVGGLVPCNAAPSHRGSPARPSTTRGEAAAATDRRLPDRPRRDPCEPAGTRRQHAWDDGPPEWVFRDRFGEWIYYVLATAYHQSAGYETELRTARHAPRTIPGLPRPRVNEVRALAALGASRTSRAPSRSRLRSRRDPGTGDGDGRRGTAGARTSGCRGADRGPRGGVAPRAGRHR